MNKSVCGINHSCLIKVKFQKTSKNILLPSVDVIIVCLVAVIVVVVVEVVLVNVVGTKIVDAKPKINKYISKKF